MQYLFLSIYSIVVLLFCLVFFFGDHRSNSPLGKFTYCTTIWLPEVIREVCLKIPIVGPKLVPALGRFLHYVINERNPIMQFFYALLLVGGTGVYHVLYSHLVPNSFLGPTHSYAPYVFLGMVMYSFYLACTVDAGTITEKSLQKYGHYEYDGLLYVKNKCDTCKVVKLPRSKHCKICNKCVARFDHHCPWLNQCVGENNYRHFLAFLSLTVFYLLYAVYVLCSIMMAYVVQSGLLQQPYMQNKFTGEKIEITPFLLLQFVAYKFSIMIGLVVLCSVMAVVVFGFLMFHIYLVCIGKTTNEQSKWDTVSYFYKNKKRLIEECEKEVEKLKAEDKRVRQLSPEDFLNPDVAPALPDRMATEFPEKKPDNIYNFGIMGNFSRVLAPMLYQQRNLRKARMEKTQKEHHTKGNKNGRKKKMQ